MPTNLEITECLLEAHIQYAQQQRAFTKIRGIHALREKFALSLVDAKNFVNNSGHPFETDYRARQFIKRLIG